MKVLMLQDVPKIGKKGEVVEVNQGYGTNFLLPQKKARVASKKDEQQVKNKQAAVEAAVAEQKGLVKKKFAEMKGSSISVAVNANEAGHLFSQVHVSDVIDAIKNQLQFDATEQMITMPQVIKEVGEYEVSLQAFDSKVQIALEVKAA